MVVSIAIKDRSLKQTRISYFKLSPIWYRNLHGLRREIGQFFKIIFLNRTKSLVDRSNREITHNYF